MILAEEVLQEAIERRALTGALSFDSDSAALIESAERRYVLDDGASTACFTLVENARFDPADKDLCLPQGNFWVEMTGGADRKDAPVGLLVQGEGNGRSGFVRHFSRDGPRVIECRAWTEFDLDRVPGPEDGGLVLYSDGVEHLAATLRHAVVHLDRLWDAPSRGRSESGSWTARHLADAVRLDLPTLLAFKMLLTDGSIEPHPHPVDAVTDANALEYTRVALARTAA